MNEPTLQQRPPRGFSHRGDGAINGRTLIGAAAGLAAALTLVAGTVALAATGLPDPAVRHAAPDFRAAYTERFDGTTCQATAEFDRTKEGTLVTLTITVTGSHAEADDPTRPGQVPKLVFGTYATPLSTFSQALASGVVQLPGILIREGTPDPVQFTLTHPRGMAADGGMTVGPAGGVRFVVAVTCNEFAGSPSRLDSMTLAVTVHPGGGTTTMVN